MGFGLQRKIRMKGGFQSQSSRLGADCKRREQNKSKRMGVGLEWG